MMRTDGSRKAIFLDRDGTLNRDLHYLIDFGKFELLPGVEEALRKLQDLGYRLFIVTNQSGVARGFFTSEAVNRFHTLLKEALQTKGIEIEESVFCPHHPQGIVPEFTCVCDCRKPMPGMLHYLESKYHLDMASSYMVGDALRDAEAGLSAGAVSILLKPNGDPKEEWDNVDNLPNLKEFVSLLDFAKSLTDFNSRNIGLAPTPERTETLPRILGKRIMEEEYKTIEELYHSGQLNSICIHLLEFVSRHRAEIKAMADKNKAGRKNQIGNANLEATKQLIQHRGSIHLPSEMADQIKEINNEIWYRGEHGDYDRAKIKEEWAMRYASMWRNFRIKEILYVVEQKSSEIDIILSGK